jgi:hypothetical protein
MAGDMRGDAPLQIHPDILANLVFPRLMSSVGDEIPKEIAIDGLIQAVETSQTVADTGQTWSIHIMKPNREFRISLRLTRYHIVLFQKSGVCHDIDLKNSKKRTNEKTVRSSILSPMKSPHKGALCIMVLRPSIRSIVILYIGYSGKVRNSSGMGAPCEHWKSSLMNYGYDSVSFS